MKRVEVFLRFIDRNQDHEWALATGDDADLVLSGAADSDGEDTVPMALDAAAELAPAIVRILDAGQALARDGEPHLRRPLQFDAFEALLRLRESQLRTRVEPRDVAPRAMPVPVPAAMQAPPGLVAAASLRPAPSSPESTRSTMSSDRRYTYRLLKWPASDLLRGRPKLVRVLGFLTQRALSVERLSVLSGVDEATCLELMTLLDERRLLKRHDAEPDSDLPAFEVEAAVLAPVAVRAAPGAATLEAARPSAPARAGEAVANGLFQRLRKRLGLS